MSSWGLVYRQHEQRDGGVRWWFQMELLGVVSWTRNSPGNWSKHVQSQESIHVEQATEGQPASEIASKGCTLVHVVVA